MDCSINLLDFNSSNKSLKACECINGGKCVNGECVCPEKYHGNNCQIPICPNNCNFQGTCTTNNECKCLEGFYGVDCKYMDCKKDNRISDIRQSDCLMSELSLWITFLYFLAIL